MNLDKDILTKISEMASALMQPREIAILLDIDADDFEHHVNHNPSGDPALYYFKGRLQTKLELRQKIVQLAKAGSPQAEVLADKYIK